MDQKGKSVLEYIMIYGWVVIVLIVILLAVSMYISPSTIQGKVCNPRIANFVIELETSFGPKEALLVLTNQTGKEVSNMNVKIEARSPNNIISSLKGITMRPEETVRLRMPYQNKETLRGEYIIDIEVAYDTLLVNQRTGVAQCRGSV